MASISGKARLSVVVLLGVSVGVLSAWLTHDSDAKKFNALKKNPLCVLVLPEGSGSASATFTNARPIEMFHVGIQTPAGDATLSVSISGPQGVVGSASVLKSSLFGLGKAIQPGNYTVALRQEAKGKGGTVVIADAAPVYLTGWQIWSRTYVGLLAFSGVCVVLLRKAADSRKRAFSLTAFHSFLLGLVLIFLYLLFHEGGHALVQIAFGHFDLARSDFWGIHGHPHSGGRMGPPLKPWQHTLISCAGPMLPTLVGFGLFLLWTLPAARNLRASRPMVNLYFSAIVALLVVGEAFCGPAYLLGIITAEGDLLGYVARTGGPLWLARGFLLGTCVFSAVILWRVAPEIWKAWRTRFVGPCRPAALPPRPEPACRQGPP